MTKEDEWEKYKKETLENWWVPKKGDAWVFAIIYLINVTLLLNSGVPTKDSFLFALLIGMIFMPIGHIIGYFIVKLLG